MTTTTSNGDNLKEIISNEQGSKLHDQVSALVNWYIENCKDSNRVLCRDLVFNFLGDDAYMAVDEVYCMREAFLDLLVFLADPEIIERFQMVATSSYHKSMAGYIRRVINLLISADNSLTYAELAKSQLDLGNADLYRLNKWYQEYSLLLQKQAS
jgi:hypothetical protein